MKYIIGIVSIGFMFLNIFHKSEEVKTDLNVEAIFNVPKEIIEKDNLIYHNHSSIWTLDKKVYSGYVESYYPDGSVKQRFGVYNGLKQGESLDWFEDGHLKFSSYYHQGKLHNVKKVWYGNADHQLASELNYHLGTLNGLQLKWYPTGEIYKRMNMNMGIEEGMQQAYRKNGVLYANYEAREGRAFGLKRASLCFELENESLVYGDSKFN